MKRRVAALFLGATATLLFVALPAYGATTRSDARVPSGTPGSTAPAIGTDVLSAAPAPGSSAGPANGFALTLDAGGSSHQNLVVTNHSSDRRLTVGVEPVDATNSGGNTTYGSTATTTGGGSWVTAAINEVVIEPNANAIVPLTIAVPSSTAAGDEVWAGIHVYGERADSASGGAPIVDHLPSLDVPIGITVAGTPAPQIAVTSVQQKQQGTRTSLQININNSGAVAADVSGTVTEPGSTLSRKVHVTVEARKQRSVLVNWPAFDSTRGADVDVELSYGNGNVASWIGNVQTAGSKPATNPTTAATDNATGPTTSASASKSSSGEQWLRVGAIAFVIALMLAAGAFLLRELLRPLPDRPDATGTVGVPLDIGSIPPLHITMDPAHTDVLNALVAQVAALAAVIERLADRVGIPLTLPPGPPIIGAPSTSRRRRRRAAECAPPPPSPPPPAAPATAESPPPAPAPFFAPDDDPVVIREPEPNVDAPRHPPAAVPLALEHEHIEAATDAVVASPSPPAPPPVSVVASIRRRAAAASSTAAPTGRFEPRPAVEPHTEIDPPPRPSFIAPPPVDDDQWPTDEQVNAFLERRGDAD